MSRICRAKGGAGDTAHIAAQRVTRLEAEDSRYACARDAACDRSRMEVRRSCCLASVRCFVTRGCAMEGPLSTMSCDALAACVGTEVGVSDWFPIDQAKIDAFADLTHDHYFIHVDRARAATTRFGGTIAHGFLTLSMLAPMAYQACPAV